MSQKIKEIRTLKWKSSFHFFLLQYCALYPEYLKDTKRTRTSFFANPGVKILPKYLITYKDTSAWHKTGRNSKSESFSWKEQEYSQKFKDQWESYIATNPEVVKRGCGVKAK